VQILRQAQILGGPGSCGGPTAHHDLLVNRLLSKLSVAGYLPQKQCSTARYAALALCECDVCAAGGALQRSWALLRRYALLNSLLWRSALWGGVLLHRGTTGYRIAHFRSAVGKREILL
jgi:hypothetical protein